MANDDGTMHLSRTRRKFFGHGPRNDHRTRRYPAFENPGHRTAHIQDRGSTGQDNPGPQNNFFFEVNPFDDNAARSQKTTVFDHDRTGLYRF
jgi:hypothetical protein